MQIKRMETVVSTVMTNPEKNNNTILTVFLSPNAAGEIQALTAECRNKYLDLTAKTLMW